MKIDLFLKMAHELNVVHFPQGVWIRRDDSGEFSVHIATKNGFAGFCAGSKSYDAAWETACDKMIATAKQQAEKAEREVFDAKNRASRAMDLVPE